MLLFDIIVVPLSGKQCIIFDKHNRLKAFLKSAPEKGKANKELIKLLAELTGSMQNQFTIVKGLSERKKRIAVAIDISFALLLHRLGLDQQMRIK